MFGKKKVEEPKPQVSYKDWESDFGFLMMLLSRKKNITKQFVINISLQQKQSERDFITDEEIETIVSNCVSDVLKQTSEMYRNYLIEKYFGTYDALVQFITEDCYIDLVSDSINRNTSKIKANMVQKSLNLVSEMNKKGNKTN